MKKTIIDSIVNLNDNLICQEVVYGNKTSLDEQDTSTKFYEVVKGDENNPNVPDNEKILAGDLLKYNGRFLSQEVWIEGKLYCVTDRRTIWFKISKENVKTSLIKRRSDK